jgi:DNA-directed RNA polymerase subunit RPC12/RpoP
MEVIEMSKLKYQISMLLVGGLALMLARSTWAQEGDIRLSLRKDWGFSLGGQVQGLFTLSGTGAQDLTSVSFELDGKELAAVTRPPFTLQFSTDKYPSGRHTFSAVGRTSDGRILKSNTVNVEFVSAEAGWQTTQRIIIPLLVVVCVVIILTTAGQFALGRGQRHLEPGTPRNYGLRGGAICPKCGRPFALSFFSLNLVTRRFERCPYCGKWGLVQAASREALTAAEAAEVAASRAAVPEPSSEEKLRRQIEESRYQ